MKSKAQKKAENVKLSAGYIAYSIWLERLPESDRYYRT